MSEREISVPMAPILPIGGLCRWVSLLVFILLTLQGSILADEPTITARVIAELCPEFARGGVDITFAYTVVGSSSSGAAETISQEIDTASNRGTFQIRVPRPNAGGSLLIGGYCISSRGTSRASNLLTITPCELLGPRDSDGDHLTDAREDRNCNGTFDSGDLSHYLLADTDGDGEDDDVELKAGRDPLNLAVGGRLFVQSGGVFDPDRDGEANPVIWRPSTGEWFVQNQSGEDRFFFGRTSDIPFTYRPLNGISNVGVIRQLSKNSLWLFRGAGFSRASGGSSSSIAFGNPGDRIVLGPWEEAEMTSPAVTRATGAGWLFLIYLRNGSLRSQLWGNAADIPCPADFDGDGRFDYAVYRPAEQTTYVLHSTGAVSILNFGPAAGVSLVRGDTSGDGVDDISFWHPGSFLFESLLSDNGFDSVRGQAQEAGYYQSLSLPATPDHRPLSWNRRGGKILYTLVDHRTGTRIFREGNSSLAPVTEIQLGQPGDAQG